MKSYYDDILSQERKRRIECEAPPSKDYTIHIDEYDGTKYKVYKNGKIWEKNNPCVKLTNEECLEYLTELNKEPTYILSTNNLNVKLITMLCSWRKHIKNTYIIKQNNGSTKWNKIKISTSELKFLNRNKDNGGIIPILFLSNNHINSLESLASLTDVKGLSSGFLIIISMYMDWDIYSEVNKSIIINLLKKERKNGKNGLEIYNGTLWFIMFDCILKSEKIPDSIKECILSRAHLP